MQFLTTIPIRNCSVLMSEARVLRSRTPSSFRSLLFDICFKPRTAEQTEALTKAIVKLPCLTIPTHEVHFLFVLFYNFYCLQILTQCYHSLLGLVLLPVSLDESDSLYDCWICNRGWNFEIFYFWHALEGSCLYIVFY